MEHNLKGSFIIRLRFWRKVVVIKLLFGSRVTRKEISIDHGREKNMGLLHQAIFSGSRITGLSLHNFEI
jgi:hypothetical protein